MCGITGAVWRDQRTAVDAAQLAKMTDAIAHRGPDDSQSWSTNDHRDAYGNHIGVALGFRRLSIIDVAGARQPMANEDGTVRMVFNGEIYNYQTLRRRLEGRGHQFATNVDAINQENPDLVLFSGDFVGGHTSSADQSGLLQCSGC